MVLQEVLKLSLRIKHHAIFRELQRNPMQQSEILHFDLMKVSADDVITASVPITLIGREEVENNSVSSSS